MHKIETANRRRAGIVVPDTSLVNRALEYARQECEPYLFNHVIRSWLFAARLGQLQNIEHDAEVVAVGTIYGREERKEWESLTSSWARQVSRRSCCKR